MISIRPDVVVQPALEPWEVFFLAAAGAGAVLLLQAGIAAAPEVAGDLVRWWRSLRLRLRTGQPIRRRKTAEPQPHGTALLDHTAEDPSTFADDMPHPPSIILEADAREAVLTFEDAARAIGGMPEAFRRSLPGVPTEVHDVLADEAWKANGRVPEVPAEARKRWVATASGLHFKGCRYANSGKEIDATSVQAAAAYAVGHRPPLRICTNCHPLSLAAPAEPPAGKTVLT